MVSQNLIVKVEENEKFMNVLNYVLCGYTKDEVVYKICEYEKVFVYIFTFINDEIKCKIFEELDFHEKVNIHKEKIIERIKTMPVEDYREIANTLNSLTSYDTEIFDVE